MIWGCEQNKGCMAMKVIHWLNLSWQQWCLLRVLTNNMMFKNNIWTSSQEWLCQILPHQSLASKKPFLSVRFKSVFNGMSKCRVVTDLENLEKPENLKETSESQGIYQNVRKFVTEFQKSGNFVVLNSFSAKLKILSFTIFCGACPETLLNGLRLTKELNAIPPGLFRPL